jgi:hypothetical protein
MSGFSPRTSPRVQRCDANSKSKHLMRVHDGMINSGKYKRLNGCHRKGFEVLK